MRYEDGPRLEPGELVLCEHQRLRRTCGECDALRRLKRAGELLQRWMAQHGPDGGPCGTAPSLISDTLDYFREGSHG